VPPLTADIDEHQSALEAFSVGDQRIVLAIHLAEPPAAPGAADVLLTVAGLAPAALNRIERVGAAGMRSDLMQKVVPADGGMTVRVPCRDAAGDEPVGGLARTDFYVAITLR
jgi:hypothetical protein